MIGIVYKIECNITGDTYYGSTSKSLSTRMIKHIGCCNGWKQGKAIYMTSFKIIDRGNYSYCILETIECEDRKQLEQRERYYIENNECVNRCVPGRTEKEHKEYHDMYYKHNKEKLLKNVKEYQQANQDKIKIYQEAYREANREKSKEYFKQRYLKRKQQELI